MSSPNPKSNYIKQAPLHGLLDLSTKRPVTKGEYKVFSQRNARHGGARKCRVTPITWINY